MKLSTKIFLLLTLCIITLSRQNGYGQSDYELQHLPEFSLLDLDSQTINNKYIDGKFTVIHIATTWCPFCNAEAPHLQQLFEDYRDYGVKVLIIDVKESADLVRNLLADRHQISFPILLDSDGSVAASMAPEHILPDLARDEVMLASNILVDPTGKIQFMSLLDTRNFDANLVDLKTKLNELLNAKYYFLPADIRSQTPN